MYPAPVGLQVPNCILGTRQRVQHLPRPTSPKSFISSPCDPSHCRDSYLQMLKSGPKNAQDSIPASQKKERQDRFMQLLLPVQKRLEAFCFAMTRNDEEACDLVGETILRAYEHFAQIRDSEAFLSYLFTIASRLHKRKRWRGRLFGSYDSDAAEAMPYGGTAPDVSVDVEKLYDALAQLPDQQREAIVLYELTGLSVAEIQEIQGGS